MKESKSIIAAVITIILLTGMIFKIMHWPGSGPMLLLSASSLSMYLAIAIAKLKPFHQEKLSYASIKSNITGLSGSILAIGLLFKMMHWPGAGPMIYVGLSSVIIAALLYMIDYFRTKKTTELTPEIIFIFISFFILFYTVSVGGSSRSVLINICDNAIKIEKNSNMIMENTILLVNSQGENEKLFYEESNKLNQHIQNLKSELYLLTDGLSKEVADTISLKYINGKDNYDIPSHLMGLADPSNPIKVSGKEEFSAITLREKIDQFNNNIFTYSGLFGLDDIRETILIKEIQGSEGVYSWEVGTFYHMSLANVILTLNQLQLEANIICNDILIENIIQSTNNQQPEPIK
jgi:hypothetical protein